MSIKYVEKYVSSLQKNTEWQQMPTANKTAQWYGIVGFNVSLDTL